MAEGEAWDRFRAMMAQAGLTCTPTKFLPLGMDSVTILSCTSVRLFGAEVLLPRRPGCDRAPGGNGPVYGPYTPYAAFNDAQQTQGVAGLKFDALKGTSLPPHLAPVPHTGQTQSHPPPPRSRGPFGVQDVAGEPAPGGQRLVCP